MDIAQIQQGQEPKPKKKYRLVDDYRRADMAQFLNNIAGTVSF
jgi:hypothetical protein